MTVIVLFQEGWDIVVQNTPFIRILKEVPDDSEAKKCLVAGGSMGLVSFPRQEPQLAHEMARILLDGTRRYLAREESAKPLRVDEYILDYLRRLAAETEDYLNGRDGPTQMAN